MANQDLQVEFFKTYYVIKDNKKELVASGVHVGGLYQFNFKRMPHQALASTRLKTKKLWHQRFGHLNLQDLMALPSKGIVDELPTFQNVHLDCDGCALGKMHRQEFHLNTNRKKIYILELLHTDICGPMQTRSVGGAYYFLPFTNDCTIFSWVYFIREKSHRFQCFK